MQRKPAKRTPRNRQPTRNTRLDDWANLTTQLGQVGFDKRTAQRPGINRASLTRRVQEDAWRGSDLAAKIVELLPKTCLREGFTLKVTDATAYRGDAFGPPQGFAPPAPKAPPPEVEPQDTGQDIARGVLAKYDELNGYHKLREAWDYARAYGGGAVIIGADDGSSDWSQPLDEANIRTVGFLNAVSRYELFAQTWYGDPMAANYGRPETYILNPLGVGTKGASQQVVHESRLILFSGPAISNLHRVESQGWGDTIFTRILPVLNDFETVWGGSAALCADFAQAVIKLRGLAAAVSSGNEALVVKRAQIMNQLRSVLRAIVMDAEAEDFERKATPMSGYPETMQQWCNRLAAAANIPVSLIMGQAPAGLNATGESDVRAFYDDCAGVRNHELRPQLTKLVRVLLLAKDGPTGGAEPEEWCVEFPPLWQATDKEKAETRLAMANADTAYVNAGIATPAEIAASRWGGDKYSLDTVIDVADRTRMAKEYAQKTAEAAKAAVKLPAPDPNADPNAGK